MVHEDGKNQKEEGKKTQCIYFSLGLCASSKCKRVTVTTENRERKKDEETKKKMSEHIKNNV